MDHQYGGGSWMRVPSQNSMAQDPHPLQSQYQQPQQQQHHHHPSLASNFHLLHMLLERLADAIESGTRDQHFDALRMMRQLDGFWAMAGGMVDEVIGAQPGYALLCLAGSTKGMKNAPIIS